MRNIAKYNIEDSTSIIYRIIEKLKSHEWRETLKFNEDKLLVAYKNYDTYAKQNKLEKLSPIEISEEHSKNLKKIYDRRRTIINEVWINVSKNNDKYILCPICGCNIVRDFDHYIPKSLMPEFSFHPHNLIPLCTSCNDKKTSLWLENNERIIFNTYFDKLDDIIEFLSYEIIIDNNYDYPQIKLFINENKIQVTGNLGKLIRNTINKLNLFERIWQNEANKELKDKIRLITKTIEIRITKESFQDILRCEKQILEECILDLEKHDFIKKIVWISIIESKELDKWFSQHCNLSN